MLTSFHSPVFTTSYAEFNRPVYDAMVSYLLWKARGRALRWPDELGERGLSGRDKDALLARLAEQPEVDYDDVRRRRLLHLMSLSEARELAGR